MITCKADGKLVNETIESTPTENVLIEEVSG
jgi:hypothetical protein